MTLPPEQEAIRAKCFHPSGEFVEFPEADVETSIPARFEKMVRLHPDRVAVKMAIHGLTYDELNRAANRVAHAILEKGAGGSEPITLLFEHGLDAVVAILGTLKANRCWLALDPSESLQRLNNLAAISETALIITNQRHLSLARNLIGRADGVLAIGEIADSISSKNLNLKISATSAANIYLTSGSTGEPKGVYQTHDRVLHDARNQSNFARITPEDKLSQLFSVCFSTGEINLTRALLNGACLCLFDPKLSAIGDLIEWVKNEKLTVCHLPVALFRQFAESIAEGERFPELRLIQLSGAPISQPVFELYKSKCRPDLLLQIHMGSTEAGGICGALIDRTFCYPQSGTPTGYPYPGKRVSILDGSGREVQPGQVGQIAVQSRFLARGYWQAANGTESGFLQDPDCREEAMYLTGDLGHMLPDGMLVHDGRSDFIVKIRGYRVNIYEVERVLAAHPFIKESGVVAWDKGPHDKMLVGYIVLGNNSSLSVEEIRNYLRQKVADYMIPSVFEFKRALPLTASGKLDRKALPRPCGKRPELSTPYVMPQNETEESLVRVWEEVLDVYPIGIDDNFFDLGGHSLAATRIATRIIDQCELDIPLQSLFESPTIAAMAALISTHKGRTRSERDKAGVVTGGLSLRPVARDGKLPLSFAQQRLWLLNELDPHSSAYHQPMTLRLKGRLNVAALQEAFDEIVGRHEVLRTTYSRVDGRPTQIIHTAIEVNLTSIDLTQLAYETQRAELKKVLSELVTQRFSLERDCPLRAALIRLMEQEHVLLFVTHHIASDGWSSDILSRELSELYEVYSQGKANPLNALRIQYADYAVWQRESLKAEVLERQLTYWRKQLADISPLELPTDRSRPASLGYAGRTAKFTIPPALAQRLKKLSQQRDVTLFITLLAGFQTLLHRYTGQDDIAVGTPTAGRNRGQFEGLIGCFINMLVIRNDLSGNPSFNELLGRVKANAFSAYSHQDMPFERLVEELQPERSLNRTPLFQVLFQLRNYPRRVFNLEDLKIEEYEFESEVAKFDLSVGLQEQEEEIAGTAEYRTDLFDASTIERMVGHFKILLEGIVTNPNRRLSELPILTEPARHQILVEWNATEADYPRDKCINRLFEEQVERSPDAIAVVFKNHQVTYRELNWRANQLAHSLIREGVQSGTAVGIYLDRSIELAVGLLAVLKAGGVYVPIDPSCPIERATFILRDVQAPFVVSTRDLASRLSLIGARTITLDRELQKLDWADNSNPGVVVGPQFPAYILFTSGSTGAPKGVVMSHRALNNLIAWQVNSFGQGVPARTLQFAPLGFDVSIQEMFSTWCSGGSLYFIDNDLRQDGSSTLHYIDKQSIERIFLPFVALNHFAEIAVKEDHAPQSLREIVTAGEPLRLTQPLRQFLDNLDNCRLHNQYGPTESHVVTEYTLNPAIQREPDLPPIGRPIANAQIFILDSYFNPVPVGVTGELHIGGDGLACGYLNRPELTAEKFIANPLSDEPGSRLYRTGDLARYLPDGNIEYLGRIDNQVKIRGFRIELGEIEAVLAQHPGIQQAVVLAREDTPGDKRLVAYVVTAGGSTTSVHDLRSYLQHKLPDYMVPSAFVFLDSLPLNANGKLDRKALPAPEQSRPGLDDAFTPPTTPVEEILANIWSEILKLDKVGIHDNFFHLGGHSLLATQIVSRVRSEFDIELPLRRIFESPTVAEMAILITVDQTKGASRPALMQLLPELEAMTEEEAEKKITEPSTKD